MNAHPIDSLSPLISEIADARITASEPRNPEQAFLASVTVKPRSESGFSLIATHMIMSLLAVIAVGLLSLSIIDLRSARSGATLQGDSCASPRRIRS